jgi:hypothetical protein
MKITQFILTDYFTISDAAGGEVCRFKPKFNKTFARRSVSQTIETANFAVSTTAKLKTVRSLATSGLGSGIRKSPAGFRAADTSLF